VPQNEAMKLTSALAERADLLGVTCWRSAMGRQEAPRRSQLIASVLRTRWWRVHRNGPMARQQRAVGGGSVLCPCVVAGARPRMSVGGALPPSRGGWGRPLTRL
jgi:hypothetical protein